MSNNIPSNKKRSNKPQGNAQAPEPHQRSSNIDLDTIKSFPLRTIRSGEKMFKGYYDESSLIVYLADEYGNLTGKKAQLTKPLPPETPAADKESPEPEQDTQSYKDAAFDAAKNMLEKTSEKKRSLVERHNQSKRGSKSEKSEKPKRGFVKGVIIALAVAAVAGGCIFIGMNYMSSRMLPFVGQQNVEPQEGMIMVIQLDEELIPGDQVTESMIHAYNIDSETYNNITSNGSDLYRWEQRDSVIGMYATEYVAEGKYITTTSVIRSYTPPSNPYSEKPDGMELVDIPISIQDLDRTTFLIGSKINIQFVTNIQEDNTAETRVTQVAGARVTAEKNITTTDSYSIDGLVIADLLTSSGESLFERYNSLSAIPEINQVSYLKAEIKVNREYMTSIAPAQIRVLVDKEYADALTKAMSNGATVSMTEAEGEDVSTTEKQEFMDAQKKLMESFTEVLG